MAKGIIIQARLTSKRFPNKMLCPLAGKPVLQWTIEAVKKTGIPFVITIPDQTTDRGLAEWIKLYDPIIKCYFASENDLIERFRYANMIEKFNPIIRICGDSPFMNPEDVSIACELYEKRKKYTRVNLVEVFSKEELDYCADNDPFISRREHCVNMLSQTVDYPEDIKRLENEM